MKRKIAIVLAVAMAAACLCLAGCSKTLEDEDFQLYDKDGNVIELYEEPNGYKTATIRNEDGGSTSRGIKIGSTLEEVKEAYSDVWGTVEEQIVDSTDGDNFTTTYKFRKDKTVLTIMVINSSETVGNISVMVKP